MSHTCEICGREFVQQQRLTFHLKSHGPAPAPPTAQGPSPERPAAAPGVELLHAVARLLETMDRVGIWPPRRLAPLPRPPTVGPLGKLPQLPQLQHDDTRP
jgi:hypothetical protein